MSLALETALQKRHEKGNFRTLPSSNHLIDFASNDYLGFARSKELFEAIQSEWRSLIRVGSTGSRLFTGNSEYCLALEKSIAHHHRAEKALIFQTGFCANLGLLSALSTETSTVLFDQEIHASTRLGIKLGKGKSFAFKHNDLNHLEHRLQKSSSPTFVCVESLYSTSGTFSPLQELVFLCEKYSAFLVVDEAHSTGVFGDNGEGLVCAAKLESRVFARVHTFSKALGIQGAAVVGNALLNQMLINFAIPFIYSTALPFYSLAAIKCAYQRLGVSSSARADLFSVCGGVSPILIHPLGTTQKIDASINILKKEGFAVAPLKSPTVPLSAQGLRISFHAFNTLNQKKRLMQCVKSL